MEGPQSAFDDGFQITVAASYRIYWDGVLIGASGAPGATPTQEVVGPLDNLFTVPLAGRSPGEHVIAMQVSAFKNRFPERRVRLLCFSGPAAALEAKMLLASAFPVIGAAALCMLAVASWVIWLLGVRNVALRWFAAICTFAALFQAVLAARFATGYPYTWAYPMILIRGALMGAIGFSLVMFVAERFGSTPRRWITAGILIAFAGLIAIGASRHSEQGAVMLTTASWLALALATWSAVKSHAQTDWLIVGGVGLVSGLATFGPQSYFSSDFFPLFLPTELCLMGVLVAQVRRNRRRMQEMQLRSARLEIELLKKNLQPHFLFNTLAAVSEVIEQTPSVAGALIDDLTEEFRALTRLSGEKLIPISQELSLCDTHLRVVRHRMGITCELQTTGRVNGLLIPPAIFLTLVENAFTHQSIADSDGIFRLSVETSAKVVTFRFFSPGEIVSLTDHGSAGTGLRYVKARLEESFPGRWSFWDQAVGGGWETRIEIKSERLAQDGRTSDPSRV
jgi:hypothetical protein